MDLLDAVHWQNLLPFSGPVAAYRDGPVSQWSPDAFKQLDGRIAVNITVLADEAWEVFDSETGNAGVDAVATAIANRYQDRKWSWAYSNRDNLPGLTQALKRKSLTWTDASMFPALGVYLWVAAPGTSPGRTPPGLPVQPVAVQDRAVGPYDASTLFVNVWTPPAPPPAPPAPKPPLPPKEIPIAVQLLQVQEGNQGDVVKSLQILLNGRGPYAIQVDGIFGPKTLAAVRGYQQAAHIGVDGIAGVHTWGHLLGVPQ